MRYILQASTHASSDKFKFARQQWACEEGSLLLILGLQMDVEVEGAKCLNVDLCLRMYVPMRKNFSDLIDVHDSWVSIVSCAGTEATDQLGPHGEM